MQVEQPVTLPNLPGMFFRSLFTVARNDQEEAEPQTLDAEFTAPAFSATQLKRYHEAFNGFVSEVPLTLIYCLAQRVHLAQMLGEHFPWPAPGLVHVSNSIEQHETIVADEGFLLKASIQLPARGPKVSARRLRPLFQVEFWQNDKHVATCVSEYQVMPKQTDKPRRSKENKIAEPPSDDWQRIDTWKLAGKVARDYARLSGDFNPIHLHPLLSRWFGFDQPIIHGMYMSGRAQAEVERAAKRPVTKIDVAFKRPVPLPAKVSLWQQLDDNNDGGQYQVCGAEDHLQRLEGRFIFAKD
ncbi:acyl dehydratase [Pseudidiomarina tainanensis]|uniref:MaoC like domain-containing protein n=2 Tax=Pseudidiomarina TaxID=2800384 RepID=A0A1I6H4T8_9GAMM|nr:MULTISPECIES: MaoC/PaaZ C-terminal domain-containing protein [Pseudidiomarina]RZQ55505.1 acyl dehydratase [Pseudidiomarina tainanensis]SFR49495.1 MaoC like domain-containing protein [Pseudidiomarina maritima]